MAEHWWGGRELLCHLTLSTCRPAVSALSHSGRQLSHPVCFVTSPSHALKAAGAKIHTSHGAGRTQCGCGNEVTFFFLFSILGYKIFSLWERISSPQRGDVSHMIYTWLSWFTNISTPLRFLKSGQVIKWLYETFIAHLYVTSGTLWFTKESQSQPATQASIPVASKMPNTLDGASSSHVGLPSLPSFGLYSPTASRFLLHFLYLESPCTPIWFFISACPFRPSCR